MQKNLIFVVGLVLFLTGRVLAGVTPAGGVQERSDLVASATAGDESVSAYGVEMTSGRIVQIEPVDLEIRLQVLPERIAVEVSLGLNGFLNPGFGQAIEARCFNPNAWRLDISSGPLAGATGWLSECADGRYYVRLNWKADGSRYVGFLEANSVSEKIGTHRVERAKRKEVMF